MELKSRTTDPARSALMRRVRQEGTAPELAVGKILSSTGCRYFTNVKVLPGSPDFVVPSAQLAIFVHGCFWHRHQGCSASTLPKSNRKQWLAKFRANVRRDRRVVRRLQRNGYRVITIWECQTKSSEAIAVVERRVRALLAARQRPSVEYSITQGRKRVVRQTCSRHGTIHKTMEPLQHGHRPALRQAPLALAFDYSYLRRTKPKTRRAGRSVRVVDLFSGCGAMSLGVQEACRALGMRFVPVMAADRDAEALLTYKRNFPTLCRAEHDVCDILDSEIGARLSAVEQRLRTALGRVDLAIGGPPCQGHSTLNNLTRHADPRNSLYARMGRFAEVVRPTHLIIENVPAVTHDHSRVVEETIGVLRALGYAIDHGVVDVARLGVAQERKRHVLLASLVMQPELDYVVGQHCMPLRTVGWAIHDLAAGTRGLDAPSGASDATRKRMRYLFDHGMYDLPDSKRPRCHMFGKHSYRSVYGRLRWGRPAQTITTGFTCMGQGRFVHPRRKRTLTPHEAARLQAIPDFFRFPPELRRSALARLIGNAVPPRLSYVLALELLR